VKATGLVLVGVVALFLLHVLGTLRRRSSHKLVHGVVLGTYALSYLLVSYTLGLMQDSRYYVDEFPVWAVSLLMLLGGTDNLMACKLNDVDNWKSLQVKQLIKGVLVVGIVVTYRDDAKQYLWPLYAILVVNALQSYVRITSMRMASKSHLLWKNVKPIADYMRRTDQRQVASGQWLNPVTMEGYRYVVTGENRLKNSGKKPKDVSGDMEVEDMKITTVEEIWRCKGSLLCSDHERGLRLKDVCLSMALSKMLHRRFAGFELVEANLKKTKDFVFQGLLVGDKAYKRVFRVIGVELGFVYDLYFTRYPYLYYRGWYLALCFPFVMVILCSWLTYLLYDTCKTPDKVDGTTFPLNTTVTLAVMVVVTFLEAFQLYLHMASGWFKVALIRSYVRMPALLHGCFPRTIISLLLRLEAHRPWENKLGQYSLLQYFDCKHRGNSFLHYVTLRLVDKAMKGCKRGKPEKLSMEVKEAVVDALVRSKEGHMTNGISSLENNGVLQKLSWACEGKVIRTILVWHIATTICKQKLDAARPKKKKPLPELSTEDNTAIDTTSKVASSLSQYCAYLVAFSPDLLPGHSFDSVSMLEETIHEARELLKGAKKMGQKCDKLLESIASNGDDDPRLVVQGARLARHLTEEIQNKRLQWKVLEDFWAEMILYVAPCDDPLARAHLEALTRGGEFITHLWALLTHAGVLERDHVGPMSAV
jgi:hypothetical protein